MTAILCNAQNKGLDKPATVAALTASRNRSAGWDSDLSISTVQMLNNVRAGPFDDAIAKLQRPNPPISIQVVLQSILPSAKPLLMDPVKNADGALYVQTTEDLLSCGAYH
jgi:hypothetical protein